MGQDLEDKEHPKIKQMSMLETIRSTNKARKEFRVQMKDDSFILPQSTPFDVCTNLLGPFDEFYPSPNRVEIQRQDRKLTYNHYANLTKSMDTDFDSVP